MIKYLTKLNDMIPEILKEANKLELVREIKHRSEVAKTAKKIGLKINYTQCKNIAWVYYSSVMVNYLFIKPDESLEDYMRRIAKNA